MSEEKVSSPFAQAADLLIGAIDYSAERISKLVDSLVERGKISREEASKVAKEMTDRGREEREKLRVKLEGTFSRLRFVSRGEFEELKARVQAVEDALGASEAAQE